ncbi:hypothetical protein [Bathymodiolus japonicus methanotrophic gill symbiont]|uniref:hypothetical protein n=1 Tax=Bathymodiolus japonicus methanotrophic gill symbiont TaxID=113269 RepID=UPI001C8EF460|nr:hypothetical protein [Bathymodiolus japonicus methanotrophic gill symbiont]
MATTNGSTAIRDKILASLARYRALRIGKFPCAFWRLSARPGLTAIAWWLKILLRNHDPLYYCSIGVPACLPHSAQEPSYIGTLVRPI